MSVLHAYPTVVPLLERLRTKQNSRIGEYGSRELNNHVSVQNLSAQQKDEGSGWQVSYPQASMSDHKRRAAYDVPPSKVSDLYHTRPEINHGLPREQLPPLSSILGESRPGLSSRSPFTDQKSAFPPTSSQDSRHTSGPIRHEHQVWDAYSQRPPSHAVSSQYLYDARPAQPSISDLSQPSLRPMQISQAPNSPQFYESRYSPKDLPRTQLPPSRSGWSSRSELSYREYFPATSRDTSSSFRPQLDQHHPMPPPPQRTESENGPAYKETSNSIPPTRQYITTASSIIAEPATSKDGLGPKIWTGTQFLPRFVRQAEVPGEGLCYFYDDGTHCKTHIDGEAVNAHWGVTKAGKPRKRLAIACITCREKKIKCDPDYPRCTQCEKFGRVCKFKNAPRGGQGSPEISPEADETTLLRPVSQLSTGDIVRPEKREVSHVTLLQPSHRDPSTESDGNPPKRAKYGHSTPVTVDNDVESRDNDASLRQWTTSTGRRYSDEIMNQWATNPYDTEEDLVKQLMRLYFIHKGISGAHGILPEKPFMLWLTNRCFQKSPDDLMLIYTMLALASVFSSDPNHKERGKDFAAVSRYACDQRHYSLQLVQSRLLLALYYYAKNNVNDSWDFCGAAMRTATGMKLNLEIEEIEVNKTGERPYNLNQQGYAECRRRTFWTCFILDRFNGYCSGQLSIINPEDVFLRLPCDDKSFEEQTEVHNPYFDHKAQLQDHSGVIGEMAPLITITSIWGDIMANIYRTSHRPSNTEQDATNVVSFYSESTSRLESWHSSLPDFLSYTPENLIKATNSGILNIFITLHTLYHSAQMRLNRNVRPDAIPSEQVEHHIRMAHSHAEAVLLMADKLAPYLSRSNNSSGIEEADVAFSAPFIGYAVVHAIDILTAKGYLSSLPLLPSKFRSAMSVVTYLARYWQSAKNQKELLVARNADLIAGPAGWTGFFGERDFVIVKKDEDHGDGGPQLGGSDQKLRKGTYEMKTAIDQTMVRDHDCIYAVDLEIWDRALTNNVT